MCRIADRLLDQGYSTRLSLKNAFLCVLCASMFPTILKHRGTENTEINEMSKTFHDNSFKSKFQWLIFILNVLQFFTLQHVFDHKQNR
jgi:hypothetical protein